MSRIRHGSHMGTLPQSEVPELSSLCQCTMSDLTTSRSSGRFCLTYRVGSGSCNDACNVCLLHSHPVRQFSVLQITEPGYHVADLCLSTGKHCRTVYSRDQVYFCCQRTDLVMARPSGRLWSFKIILRTVFF